MMRRFLSAAAFAAALVFGAAYGGQAMAVEEPAYRTVTKAGDFELRAYPALIVAEVTVDGDQNTAASRGFRLLAGYIFGANAGKQSVAMTAPVTQAPVKIAMTAPVTQAPKGGAWAVRFVMPAQYTMDALPRPNDPAVRLLPQPPREMAVVRFSGLAGEGAVAEKTAELMREVSARGLRATGPVELARYDPPWTLWFMRRNEVMVAVARP
jgi:hypothetical protein